jgi:hypothetical protein
VALLRGTWESIFRRSWSISEQLSSCSPWRRQGLEDTGADTPPEPKGPWLPRNSSRRGWAFDRTKGQGQHQRQESLGPHSPGPLPSAAARNQACHPSFPHIFLAFPQSLGFLLSVPAPVLLVPAVLSHRTALLPSPRTGGLATCQLCHRRLEAWPCRRRAEALVKRHTGWLVIHSLVQLVFTRAIREAFATTAAKANSCSHLTWPSHSLPQQDDHGSWPGGGFLAQ